MKKLLYSDAYDWIVADEPLGKGGESTVYTAMAKSQRRGFFAAKPSLVVALHNEPAQLPQHYEFIAGVIGDSLDGLDSVAAPLGVVREAPGGSAVGFLMRKIDGWPLDEVRFHGVGARIAAAHALALAVADVEDRGLLWSDSKPNNVMCGGGRRRVVLIDALSFSVPSDLTWPDGSVGPRHTTMGDHQWYAPENLTGAEIKHTPHSTAWGLACVLYYALKAEHPARMLSMDGHPLALPKDATGDLFGRWSVKPPSNQRPADYGVPYDKLPDEIRWYFDQAFRFGRTQPDQRPSARMWADALGRWERRRRRRKISIAALSGAATVAAALGAAAARQGSAPSSLEASGAASQGPSPSSSPSPLLDDAEDGIVVPSSRSVRDSSRPELWNSLIERKQPHER